MRYLEVLAIFETKYILSWHYKKPICILWCYNSILDFNEEKTL
ncbi:hypothetical protein C8N37_10320 [Sphingobacterium faecium]|nr:hypothetical protein C8N37_10320 [Sphingobacterium faecium]